MSQSELSGRRLATLLTCSTSATVPVWLVPCKRTWLRRNGSHKRLRSWARISLGLTIASHAALIPVGENSCRESSGAIFTVFHVCLCLLEVSSQTSTVTSLIFRAY